RGDADLIRARPQCSLGSIPSASVASRSLQSSFSRAVSRYVSSQVRRLSFFPANIGSRNFASRRTRATTVPLNSRVSVMPNPHPLQLECDLHRYVVQRAHPHHGKSEDVALLVHFLHDVRVRGLAEIPRALLEYDFEVVAFLVEPDLQSFLGHSCLPPAGCLTRYAVRMKASLSATLTSTHHSWLAWKPIPRLGGSGCGCSSGNSLR